MLEKREQIEVPGGVAERSKAAVLKTAVPVTVPGVRIPSPPPVISGRSSDYDDAENEGEAPVVCTSVCIPPSEATLEAAIHRLTSALATATDETIADLVAERRALREELRVLREVSADIVRLDKGHTEGLEPHVTEAIVRMMVAAPGGKIAAGG